MAEDKEIVDAVVEWIEEGERMQTEKELNRRNIDILAWHLGILVATCDVMEGTVWRTCDSRDRGYQMVRSDIRDEMRSHI